MTDSEENLEIQRELFEWIPLARYLLMFPEESPAAIRQRRQRGHWTDGVHVKLQPGMGTWVNLKAVKALLERRPFIRQRGTEQTAVGESA